MKKTALILTMLFFINYCFAQVRIGLKAGVNANNAADVDGSKIKWGINAGPVLQINFAKTFFVQPELLYSLKGYQSPTSAPNFSDPATISLNYINLPVLFGLKTGQNLSIKLGPEIGRLLSAKSDVNNRDLSSRFDDFDFGADLALAFSIKKLAVDVRYNYGLKDLQHDMQYDRNGAPIGIGDFGANRVLQFSLCYFLK
ncbi:MAG TPA: porin family protein [Flavisolibacter sp.]|jgi:hypothetical protein|nr:porin family protein [Flavisolibacter sp.]